MRPSSRARCGGEWAPRPARSPEPPADVTTCVRSSTKKGPNLPKSSSDSERIWPGFSSNFARCAGQILTDICEIWSDSIDQLRPDVPALAHFDTVRLHEMVAQVPHRVAGCPLRGVGLGGERFVPGSLAHTTDDGHPPPTRPTDDEGYDDQRRPSSTPHDRRRVCAQTPQDHHPGGDGDAKAPRGGAVRGAQDAGADVGVRRRRQRPLGFPGIERRCLLVRCSFFLAACSILGGEARSQQRPRSEIEHAHDCVRPPSPLVDEAHVASLARAWRGLGRPPFRTLGSPLRYPWSAPFGADPHRMWPSQVHSC